MSTNMIDVIIPVFRLKGLKESLFSIGRNDDVKVTIVDDGQFNNYDEILKCFEGVLDIQVLQIPKNVGQGLARQYGVDRTNGKYIFFLDCGDLLYSPNTLIEILLEAERDMRISYSENNAIWRGGEDDRLTQSFTTLGQLFKRSFLNEYNIRHCDNNIASRELEDMGFLTQCDLVRESTEDTFTFTYFEPTVIKVWDENAITSRNSKEYDFNILRGFSINKIYAYNLAEELSAKGKIKLSQDNLKMHIVQGFVYSFCYKEIVKKINPSFKKNAEEGFEMYWEYVKKTKYIDTMLIRRVFSSVCHEALLFFNIESLKGESERLWLEMAQFLMENRF